MLNPPSFNSSSSSVKNFFGYKAVLTIDLSLQNMNLEPVPQTESNKTVSAINIT